MSRSVKSNLQNLRRSREGAWIEINNKTGLPLPQNLVAPVRERGLKSSTDGAVSYDTSRSREGAWIEICVNQHFNNSALVAPVRERGLKFV